MTFAERWGFTLTEKEVSAFRTKIDKNGPIHPVLLTACWLWLASLDKAGYGRVGVRRGREASTFLAHRVSFLIENGDIPEGLLVLHKCDNPPCVNPDHLFVGTYKENSDDMVKKGRSVALGLNGPFKAGSNHLNSKLTEAKVIRARKLVTTGTETVAKLAKEYGVEESTLRRAVMYKSWKHVL